MTRNTYRFSFDKKTSLSEVRDSLLLAVFSAEGLYGRARVRLYAAFEIDEKKGTCEVDAASPIGQSIVEIFTGLLTREFGDDAFTVEHFGCVASDVVGRRVSGGRKPTAL